jgi:hypothetical protein
MFGSVRELSREQRPAAPNRGKNGTLAGRQHGLAFENQCIDRDEAGDCLTVDPDELGRRLFPQLNGKNHWDDRSTTRVRGHIDGVITRAEADQLAGL